MYPPPGIMGGDFRHFSSHVSLFLLLLFVSLFAVQSTSSFTPADNYLIDCGSSGETKLPDGRNFKSDQQSVSFLQTEEDIKTSVDSIPVSDSNPLRLYLSARIFTGKSTYSFYISRPGRHWIRLHFYPLPHPLYNLTDSVFSVTTDTTVLLHDFSARDSSSIVFNEYLVYASEKLSLYFKPHKGSIAFINAVEIVSVPDELLPDSASSVPQAPDFKGLGGFSLQISHRLNIGGDLISPKIDPLSRTWLSDKPYNSFPEGSRNVTVDPKTITYPEGGATTLIAPHPVYSTAAEMADAQTSEPNFNLSWRMSVDPGHDYFIRLHFCDIVSKSLNNLVFNVFINKLTAISGLDLSAKTNALGTAYYTDFVLNASAITNGSILVQVGPTPNLQSGKPNAILNGLEIMKLNNAAGSLDGLFSVDGKYKGPIGGMSSKKLAIAGIGFLMGLTALFGVVVLLVRWQRRPKDWQKQNSFSSWLLPLHASHSSYISSKGGSSRSRRMSIFGSKKSKSNGFSSFFSNQGLGRYFPFTELQTATQNFDEKSVIGVGGFGKVYIGEIDVINPQLPREQVNLAEYAMNLHRKGNLDKIIDPKIVGTISKGSLRKFVEAAEKCLAEYGVDRPGMGDVLWNLEYALQLQEASAQVDLSEDKTTMNIQLEFSGEEMQTPPPWLSERCRYSREPLIGSNQATNEGSRLVCRCFEEMVENEDIYCEEHMMRNLDLRKEVELSMVFIRESTDFANEGLTVFPPINHENLFVDGFDRDRESPSQSSSSSRLSDSSSSSSSLSPSDSDGQFQFDWKSQCEPLETDGKSRWTSLNYYSTLETSIIQGWWKLLLARGALKFQNLVSCFFSRSSLCSLSRTIRSFYPVIVIVIWWWLRNRNRRRFRGGETEAHLRDTIKERDERIAQLLHQIAQMNDLSKLEEEPETFSNKNQRYKRHTAVENCLRLFSLALFFLAWIFKLSARRSTTGASSSFFIGLKTSVTEGSSKSTEQLSIINRTITTHRASLHLLKQLKRKIHPLDTTKNSNQIIIEFAFGSQSSLDHLIHRLVAFTKPSCQIQNPHNEVIARRIWITSRSLHLFQNLARLSHPPRPSQTRKQYVVTDGNLISNIMFKASGTSPDGFRSTFLSQRQSALIIAVTVKLSCGQENLSKILKIPIASSSLPILTRVSATRLNVCFSMARFSFLRSDKTKTLRTWLNSLSSKLDPTLLQDQVKNLNSLLGEVSFLQDSITWVTRLDDGETETWFKFSSRSSRPPMGEETIRMTSCNSIDAWSDRSIK
ncbi:unnamed protein product [Thlaspi arvense]|uniref:Malectin-like domain-containing protein n=1 Tax=Thlaspi arvense TaxID=13288 RepID=A0AAU9RIV2_THLAR|nr:unnamed protein product [Thlaspi arvense]